MQIRGSYIVRDSCTIRVAYLVWDSDVCVWDVEWVYVTLSGFVYEHRVKLMKACAGSWLLYGMLCGFVSC